MDLQIENWGVTDNTIWCNGTINWVGSPDANLGTVGAKVTMLIRDAGEKAVKVEVILSTKLFIVVGLDIISGDSIDVPTLGGANTGYPSSFSFSLSCAYENKV